MKLFEAVGQPILNEDLEPIKLVECFPSPLPKPLYPKPNLAHLQSHTLTPTQTDTLTKHLQDTDSFE